MVKLIEVIEVDRKVGKGVHGNPIRMVKQYWSTDGELLAQYDSWKERPKIGEENGKEESS